MILCDSEIRAVLRNGLLVIDPPPPPGNIGTSAVDLLLGDIFMRWKTPDQKGIDFAIDPSASGFYPEFARTYQERVPLSEDGTVLIRPGEFLLSLTRERIELPPASRLAARVEGRSSMARLGLAIHLTAPTIHAGFRGYITLEITNQGPIAIKLRPGVAICQLILEQLSGTPASEMSGMFQDQESVAGKSES